MTPHLECNLQAGVLHFVVPMGHEKSVDAFLPERAWQARYGFGGSDATLLDIYLANKDLLDTIVSDKVHDGAAEPVVLKAADL